MTKGKSAKRDKTSNPLTFTLKEHFDSRNHVIYHLHWHHFFSPPDLLVLLMSIITTRLGVS